jgi:uncharacterized protein YbbC (DUF1343 family)
LKNQYKRLFKDYKHLIDHKKVGLFCNQVSFDFYEGKYLFQMLSVYSGSVTVLVPEHGLFAEQQDQVPVENLNVYHDLDSTVRYVSLYINTPEKTDHITETLSHIDTLIIDIQDIGVRYYTFLPTIAELFRTLIKKGLSTTVVVIDRPNPAGRQVEGIILKEEYSSLIGLPGLPHRYGLTLGELCMYLRSKYNECFPLEIIPKEPDTVKDGERPGHLKFLEHHFLTTCLMDGLKHGTKKIQKLFSDRFSSCPHFINIKTRSVMDFNYIPWVRSIHYSIALDY